MVRRGEGESRVRVYERKEEKLAGGAATPFIFVVAAGSAACTRPFPAEFRDPRAAVAGIYCGHPQGCIYIHKHNGAS